MQKLSSKFKLLFLYAALWILASCQPKQLLLINSENKEVKNDKQAHIASIVAPYKRKVDSLMNEPIGKASGTLSKANGEQSLGNFAADAILFAANKQNAKAQLAFITNGGLRAELPAGTLTIGNVFELMPFDNEIVVVEMLGADIKQLIKLSVKNKNQSYSKGLEAKLNAQYAYDFLNLNDKPILDNVLYRVAMSDYLANGGDNLSMLGTIKTKYACNLKVRDGIILYIKELQALNRAVEPDSIPRIVYP